MQRPLAIVRDVPDSFSEAVRHGAGPQIEILAARRQHAAYRSALEDGGFSTVLLPGDEDHPDCPFVEDTAVCIGRHALMSRPGHPSRRREVGPVAAALAAWVEVTRMEDPATLDGGDVLQVGTTVFVGRSAGTNDAGIEALGRFAGPLGRRVVPVEVTGVLHLKSAITALDEETLLAWPESIDASLFAGLRMIPVGGDDPHAANVVRLADGRVLVADGDPRVATLLDDAGFEPVSVDVGGFAKADGGLTCLSLRFRDVLVNEAT